MPIDSSKRHTRCGLGIDFAGFRYAGYVECFGQIAPKVPVVAAADFRSRASEYGIKLDHSHTFLCRAIQLSICLRIAWVNTLNLIGRWLITKLFNQKLLCWLPTHIANY